MKRLLGSPRTLALAAGLALLLALPISAQALAANETGDVAGLVVNADGRPVEGAIVTVASGGKRLVVRTNAAGEFSLAGVAVGVWNITVDAPGYERIGDRTIDVQAGLARRVDVQVLRSPSSLVTLGRITTQAGEALSSGSSSSQELDARKYAAQGLQTIADVLFQNTMSATIVRPAGGGSGAPAVVALRGPDPTETLVDIDGHSVNSGGTGAFDVSLLDPAQFSTVQLVYGIAPSSLVGPNTIGGAINLRTLDPTAEPHALARLSIGTFNSIGETLEATGTDSRVGYALSFHRTTSSGEVNQQILAADGSTPGVGSVVTSGTAIGKVRIGFDRGKGYWSATLRDQSAYRDLSAALSSIVSTENAAQAIFNSFAGSSELAHSLSLGLDVRSRLGRLDANGASGLTLLVRHETSVDSQSVFGPATGTTPYLFSNRDAVSDDIVELDRALAAGVVSAKFDLRNERLDTQATAAGSTEQSRLRRLFAGPLPDYSATGAPASLVGLGQTQASVALRYARDAGATFHYALAVYYSDFSSFGTSLDPRFGVTWTPTADTVVRASAGTTFQSPFLPELYVPPVLPPPDANGFIDIGNPNLKADHATDFDLGVERLVASAQPTRLRLDLYQTNLRAPAQRFFPPVNCLSNPMPPPQTCESYPINVGNAAYRGVEARIDRSLSRAVRLRAGYSVNSSYVSVVSPEFQNGSIVAGEQSSGVPLHTAMLAIEANAGGPFSASAAVRYEDAYNELHRPPFATVQAGLLWTRQAYEVGLYGNNLTNVYDDKFTLLGRGNAYGGPGAPLPSDAYSLQGRSLTLVLTRRY